MRWTKLQPITGEASQKEKINMTHIYGNQIDGIDEFYFQGNGETDLQTLWMWRRGGMGGDVERDYRNLCMSPYVQHSHQGIWLYDPGTQTGLLDRLKGRMGGRWEGGPGGGAGNLVASVNA